MSMDVSHKRSVAVKLRQTENLVAADKQIKMAIKRISINSKASYCRQRVPF